MGRAPIRAPRSNVALSTALACRGIPVVAAVRLQAATHLLNRFGEPVRRARGRMGAKAAPEVFDRLDQPGLVVLDRQRIVGSAFPALTASTSNSTGWCSTLAARRGSSIDTKTSASVATPGNKRPWPPSHTSISEDAGPNSLTANLLAIASGGEGESTPRRPMKPQGEFGAHRRCFAGGDDQKVVERS
jgi:hypothetical protein